MPHYAFTLCDETIMGTSVDAEVYGISYSTTSPRSRTVPNRP